MFVIEFIVGSLFFFCGTIFGWISSVDFRMSFFTNFSDSKIGLISVSDLSYYCFFLMLSVGLKNSYFCTKLFKLMLRIGFFLFLKLCSKSKPPGLLR